MTVKELIVELQACKNQDAVVYAYDVQYSDRIDITDVDDSIMDNEYVDININPIK